MNRMNRHIDDLLHDARELERLQVVLRDEGLEEEAGFVYAATEALLTHIDALEADQSAQTPEQRLRDLLG